MANQLAIFTHCRPGCLGACLPGAHVRIHEDASAATLSGVQLMPVGQRGHFSIEDLEQIHRQAICGWPPLRLVCLENTAGDAGGVLWPANDANATTKAIATWSRDRKIACHLDGARLWNAHVASGTPLRELAAHVDSVSVCLSKGLGSPMGSLLCGSHDFIARARTGKHALGGGMRQAGVIAAAGLFAVDHHVPRLADDHRRASELATSLAQLPCWEVSEPQTNIVLARVRAPLKGAESICAPLREAGIRCYPNTYDEVRFVLHLGVNDSMLSHAMEVIHRVAASVWAQQS